jgi:mannosyltransferase OCH1-like enzyme
MWHLSKIPKILHIYWGGKKLSYLRYLTLASFRYYNPDWEIILYRPIVETIGTPWITKEQKYAENYEDWLGNIDSLKVTVKEIDFNAIGFTNSASSVHKSDYLRWILLSDIGGLWADMDILFTKSMDDLYFNLPEFAGINNVYCICSYGHSIGFLMGGQGNNYYKKIKEESIAEYKKEKYQCIGSTLCNKIFPTPASIRKVDPTAYNLSMDVVYPYDSNHVNELFNGAVEKFTNWTIGIHWYAGSAIAGTYLNATNGGCDPHGTNVIDNQICYLKDILMEEAKERKISIVMAYYNRQNLLDKTLESFAKSKVKNYELIIVDDASDTPLVCNNAKIIRVNKEDKWYNCSAVAFNRGFREATGDIILIQNPECYHVGDILDYVQTHIRNNTYLSFGCYAINKIETEAFHRGIMPSIGDYVIGSQGNGWYNHSTHRPKAYHFCSAMLRRDLDRIGGFDERYAMGVAFDDDDFIRCIRNMGMSVKIINDTFVIHQHHTHFEFEAHSAWKAPHKLNQVLYNSGYNPNVPKDYSRNVNFFRSNVPPWDTIQSNYDKYYKYYTGDKSVVIPKKLHMIWLGSPLPSQYQNIITKWKALHPAWEFKLWTDKDVIKLTYAGLYSKVTNLGIKSALLRYEILYQYGGVYVDTDFECIKPLDDLLYLDFFAGGRGANTLSPIVAEGLMGCKAGNSFVGSIISHINNRQGSYSPTDTKALIMEITWECISPLYLQHIKTSKEKNVLFPDSFFYPMPNSFRHEIRERNHATDARIYSYIKDDTHCIHLWHTSWIPVADQVTVPPVSPHHPKRTSSALSRRQRNRARKEREEQERKNRENNSK